MIDNTSIIDYQMNHIKLDTTSNISSIKKIQPLIFATVNLDSIRILNDTNQTLYQFSIIRNNETIFYKNVVRPMEIVTVNAYVNEQVIIRYDFLKNEQWNKIYIFNPSFLTNIKRITEL